MRAALRLDEVYFCTYLGISFKEYSTSKLKEEILPFHSLVTLGIKLKFDYNLIFSEEFDISKIMTQLSSGKKLSERYTIGTHTKPIVILNTLEHIERTKGVWAKSELIDGFNLDLDHLMRNDVNVNIHLNKDILSFLRAQYKLDLDFFLQMGRTVAIRLKDTPMAEAIRSQKNIGQMLEYFFIEGVPNFDENFHYSIKSLCNDYAVIEAVPRKNVLEELKLSPLKFGNDPTDYNRMGIFSSISHFQFGQFAKIQRTSDYLQGDKSSCYVIDLRPFRT